MIAHDESSETPSLRQAGRQFVRLLRLIRPYWGPLLKGIVLATVLSGVGLIAPIFTKLLIDEVYPTENVRLMVVLVGGILALTVTSTFLGLVQGYFSLAINTRLSSATSLLFFNHLQHLRARFFQEHQVGEITSRFQDVNQALGSINTVFQTVFIHGIYLVLVPPLLFALEWRLALVALVTLPLSFLITVLSGPVLRRAWKKSSEAHADLNALQVETLSHIETFKAMGLEHLVYRRARDQIGEAMEHQLRAGALGQAFGTANGLLRAANMALFSWLGWSLILDQRMTLGDFMAFSAYIGYLYNPISQLIQLFSSFQQSAVHLSRMFEYLDSPVEQDPAWAYREAPPIATPLRGAFQLSGVSFGYDPERPVLSGLDLEIPAGSITAIVGHSGSGKTSLLRLLAGLERPDAGVVRIDGRPLGELALRDLRRQIAVVWQDVGLVRGTLWDNLTLGAAEATLSQVQQTVELCGLGELLESLPEGLETTVSEWGSSLSAGQRQRVALARALIRDAPILLLDEATANIDVETEMEILRGIFAQDGKPGGKRTILFVTHRPQSAAQAERICVLQGGYLVGFGRHRELLETCPPYQRMLAISSGGSEARLPQVQGA
ncbi:MAG: peptidase domain-containing ABC transporter [Acidobacteriota bacterium]